MGFSEALESSLRALERQREAIESNLQEIENKIRALSAAGSIEDRIFSQVGDFDEMWARATLDEKKFTLKKCLYGLSVKPAKEVFNVEYHVWTIPGIGNEMAPGLYDPGPVTSKERSGGRTRPLLMPVPQNIIPLVTTHCFEINRYQGQRRAV